MARAAVLCGILLVVPVAASAQAAIDYLERQHALDLYRQNKMVDDVPVLEELAAANDKDTESLRRWDSPITR